MNYINEAGQVLSDTAVRNLYPNTSFGPTTYSEFGWAPYSPPVPTPPPELSEAQLIATIISETQSRLELFARSRNYDNILSACTYASSSIPKFAAEGQYCMMARDNTWATLYTILDEVNNGVRPAPAGFADIEADLPVLEWPEPASTP